MGLVQMQTICYHYAMDKNKFAVEISKLIQAKAAIALAGDEMTKEKLLKQIVEMSQNIIDACEGY